LLKVGDTLEEFLLEHAQDPKLRQLMMSMSEAIRTIAYKVQGGLSGRAWADSQQGGGAARSATGWGGEGLLTYPQVAGVASHRGGVA
jgi:hypothetical protein